MIIPSHILPRNDVFNLKNNFKLVQNPYNFEVFTTLLLSTDRKSTRLNSSHT